MNLRIILDGTKGQECLLNKISCVFMVYGGAKNIQNINNFVERTCPDEDTIARLRGYDNKGQHFGEVEK